MLVAIHLSIDAIDTDTDRLPA